MEESQSNSHTCSICDVPCNGYHFNCAACSACAAFFRRTVTLNKAFICSHQGNCRVHYAMRVICRACRYEKCIQRGMVRAAVQQRRPTTAGRRKIVNIQTPSLPLPRFNQSTQTEHIEPEQQNHVSSSTFYEYFVPPPSFSPKIPEPSPAEKLLKTLIEEERLVNERRRLLNGSYSISIILSSLSADDIVIKRNELKELTFGGIMKDIRPAIMIIYEWMRSWPLFYQLSPHDRTTLLRRCVLYQGILDSSYLTLRVGLPDKYVMSNGMYAGIAEDAEEGWKDEPGIIKSSLKKNLYRPLLDKVLSEVVYPMVDIELTHTEYIILKSLVCFKSTSVADVDPLIRHAILAYVNDLLNALHYYYMTLEMTKDEIAERTGNIILLISSIFCLGMEAFETHQKIQFFDLWQLDELLVKLISGTRAL